MDCAIVAMMTMRVEECVRSGVYKLRARVCVVQRRWSDNPLVVRSIRFGFCAMMKQIRSECGSAAATAGRITVERAHQRTEAQPGMRARQQQNRA
jgi:hypothetical protein